MQLEGSIQLSGDKSISHRLLMYAAITKGKSILHNLSFCDDVLSTIEVLRACNIKIDINSERVEIHGGSLKMPSQKLNMGNSGTSARLILGLLVGQNISAQIIGDKSLSKRPMFRVIKPMLEAGATIKSNNGFLPIEIISGITKPIIYNNKTKSAQVKSSLMFASLGNKSYSKIFYDMSTRNHSENFLRYMGNKINVDDHLEINSYIKLNPFEISIPGDFSNASFIIAAALIIPKSNIKIKKILYNKSRNGFLDVLERMGANIKIENIQSNYGEEHCDILVKYSPQLKNVIISKNEIIRMIDEIPVLSIVGALSSGELIIDDAGDLRYKESDRIKAICVNLKNMGADIVEKENGFTLKGQNKLYDTTIIDFGDHRISMAFHVLKLYLNKSIIDYKSKLANISFPQFNSILGELIK